MAWYRRNQPTEFELFLTLRNHIWVQSQAGVWLVSATVFMVTVNHLRKPGADPDFQATWWREGSSQLEAIYDGYGWDLQLLGEFIQHCEQLKNE